MLTEAIHTPFMSDRALSIENARYIFNTMAEFGDEISFKEGGIIANRANQVLKDACEMLEVIKRDGLFKTLEMGKFAGVKRPINGGKGLDGVVEKHNDYYNPFIELIQKGA
jgi:beta-lysine 5,6-aminomutase alpha subunit